MTIEEAKQLIEGKNYNYTNNGNRYIKNGIYDGLSLDDKCGMCIRFIIGKNSKAVFVMLEPVSDTTIIEDENPHATSCD